MRRDQMSYIALFCPAAVSLAIYRKRSGSGTSVPESVIAYLIFVLAVNWFSMSTVVYLLRIYDSEMEFMNGFTFFIKYVLIALVFALILPSLYGLISKAVKIRFDDKPAKDEKKQK